MANLYFPTDTAHAKRLSRLYQQGKLHRIRQGIYIDANAVSELEATLNSRWYEVADFLFERPVATHRTAAELKPAQGRIYLTAAVQKRRSVRVGPLQFEVFPGELVQGVEPFVPSMNRSNLARQCLENLMPSRARSGVRKTLGKEWVEQKLVQEVQTRGENGLNAVRDEAKALAPVLHLNKELEQLKRMISAILNTHPIEGVLNTRLGIAVADGNPFDEDRLQLFEHLAQYLLENHNAHGLVAEAFEYNKARWRNLAFFESYFSNYIEGTRFTIDEAEEIVFNGREVNNRHQDSHDVLAHVEIGGDVSEMVRTPTSGAEMIDILKLRHQLLLAERPDKHPGTFKRRPNIAGSTTFVSPDQVEGTLVQGFGVYHRLPAGLQRALFIHFVVAECHPFDDGNGRIARLMMNAELVATDLHKIIVPSVHRESYLNGLRQATQRGRFRTMVKVLHQLHCYAASINWLDYGEARHTLELHGADQEPDVGVPNFNRALRQFHQEYLPD